MIVFTTLWLLLGVVTPLTARSLDLGSTTPDETTAGRSLSERFLQITRKSCRGPHGRIGTCMFNYQCQQMAGQVVGACLDGFLFGACCHQAASPAHSGDSGATQPDGGDASGEADRWNGERDDQASSTTPSGATIAPGLESSILMTNTIPTALSPQESNQSGHDDVSHHLPLVLMFLDKTSAEYHAPPGGPSSDEHDHWADDNSRQPTTQSTVAGSAAPDGAIDAQMDALLSTETLVSTSTQRPSTQKPSTQRPSTQRPSTQRPSTQRPSAQRPSPWRPNRPKPGGKRPRPKPKTTTRTTTTSTTTEATSTTTSPSTTTEATSTTTSPSTTTTVTEASEEDITDQHANNVLQFLVSNPPAWVLEELMNSNASMTTWYPLPIAESLPSSPDDAPAPDTRPVKRKPVKIRPPSTKTGESTTESTTTTTTTTSTTTRKPRPVFNHSKDCGVRPMVPSARIVGGRRSDYGRWPWQVLVRESTWFGIFSKNKCGGVLISDRHVLTAAHCQPGFLGSLMVVLGEYELTSHTEPNTPVEKHVKRVVVHRDYVERTFENDLAILELDSPVEFKPYIVPICLPSTSEGDFIGRKAEVTGWGKLSHNGPTPGVLHEVDVPIMSNSECHDMFKKAGHEKRILDSFVCAGYSEGKKDSCEGDSGGPLMIEREDGRWELVGTVSHGIRCAYPNMPGVYMRMTYYRPWIERVTGIGGPQLG